MTSLMRRMLSDAAWEFGSSNPVKKGVEAAHHRGTCKALEKALATAEFHLEAIRMGIYELVDDICQTPCGV